MTRAVHSFVATMKYVLVGLVAFSLKRKAYSFSSHKYDLTATRRAVRWQTASAIAGRNGEAVSPLRSIKAIRAGSNYDDPPGSLENSSILSTSPTTLASSSIPSPSLVSSYYYLLWSPGFLKKCGIMSVSLLGLHISGWDTQLAKVVSAMWASVSSVIPSTRLLVLLRMVSIPNLLLPLLSSSCCLLQVVINMLVGAGGCAGFNTILGPVRPYLLSFLVYLNAVTGAGFRQSLLRYGIALMPEGIFFWNEYANSSWRKSLSRSNPMTSPSPINATADLLRATVVVDIPAMGCVACINKIESSLRQCAPSNIVDATSWLDADRKGGRAKVDFVAESEADITSMTQRVVEVIEGAGFHGSTVVNLEILPQDGPSPSLYPTPVTRLEGAANDDSDI